VVGERELDRARAWVSSRHCLIRGDLRSISFNSSRASAGVRTTFGRRKTINSTSRWMASFFLKSHPGPGCCEDWRLAQGFGDLFLDDAAEDEGLAIFDGEVGFEVAGVEDGAAKEGLAGNYGGGLGANSECDIAGGIDMGGDFEDDADVLVREALVQSADVGAQAAVDERHLLADEELAHFIVGDVYLRCGQDLGVGGLAEELDEDVHVKVLSTTPPLSEFSESAIMAV